MVTLQLDRPSHASNSWSQPAYRTKSAICQHLHHRGAFLVFMGINLIRNCQKGLSVQTASKAAGHSYRPIYYGITTSLSNPYFFPWWSTVGAAFMFQSFRLARLVGLASFLIGHWTSDFSWYGFVAICTERGTSIAGDQVRRFILLIRCGAFLSALGAVLVYSGLVNV